MTAPTIANTRRATIEAADAAGEVERGDEPLTGGASRQRIQKQPTPSHDLEGDDGNPLSLDAEISLVRAFYNSAIETARRAFRKPDRTPIIKALRDQMKLAIRGATERRQYQKASRYTDWRRRIEQEHKPDK